MSTDHAGSPKARPVIADPLVAGALVAQRAIYFGFTVRETSGSAVATVRIWDNPSAASGTILDTIQLAAKESAREFYGPMGIEALTGIFIEVVAGTVEGSVRHG